LFLYGHRSFFLSAFPSVLSLSFCSPYHLRCVDRSLYISCLEAMSHDVYASELSLGPFNEPVVSYPELLIEGQDRIDSFACIFIIPTTSYIAHFWCDN
jgi:hypothetical protein